jgi:3-hydroxybutyryl-CoA dehydrogenase
MSESKDGEVTIKEVGVIGAGHMGSGIAQAVAIAGYNVILVDVDEERTQAALATINGNMARQVSRSTITEDDMNEAIGRITITTEIDSLKIADIVVEAATEDLL